MNRLIIITAILFISLYACKSDNEVTSTRNIENNLCIDDDCLFYWKGEDETGISFKNLIDDSGDYTPYNTLYIYNGGGVAVGDLDNDGLQDIIFVGNQVPCKVYKNLGELKFEDVTSKSLIDSKAPWVTGVAMADINNDGWLDIYICRSGSMNNEERANLAYINNGDFTFSEQAEQLGINDHAASTQAYFFDYDNDNDLDLYVVNHPTEFRAAVDFNYYKNVENDTLNWDKLYQNIDGNFVDVTLQSGFGIDNGFGLSALIMDFNEDGWDDIFIANDFFTPDKLFINQKDKTFKEETAKYFKKNSLFSMGSARGDINNDGYDDLLVVDMAPNGHSDIQTHRFSFPLEWYQMNEKQFNIEQINRNMLFINKGDEFVDIGEIAGVGRTDWSWSPFIEPFTNNIGPDIFISNGIKRDFHDHDYARRNFNNDHHYKFGDNKNAKELIANMPQNRRNNYFYTNNNDLTFSNASNKINSSPTNTQGAAIADLDNDGDLDIILNNSDDPAGILENKTGNNFLRIKLSEDQNKNCIGCAVTIYIGDKQIVKHNYPIKSFQSSSEPILHFGLGNVDQIDSIKVQWNDGTYNLYYDITANQNLVYTKGESILNEQYATTINSALTPLNIIHKEDDFYDFQYYKLNPFLMSREGPKLSVADLDNDDEMDIIVGSSLGNTTQIVWGKSHSIRTELEDAVNYEDGAIELLDLNKDGFLDLIISSSMSVNSSVNSLRVYLNNGDRTFSSCSDCVPKLGSSIAVLQTVDIDLDGDKDVFLGERSFHDAYGKPTGFYILENNDGKLEIKQNEILSSGLIRDAMFTNFNDDNQIDLLIVGEWMTPTVYLNDGNQFKKSEGFGLDNHEGLWRSVALFDYDQDGDKDIVAGNYGLNSILKASKAEPISLYTGDFDNNGSEECLIFHYLDQEEGLYVNMADYLHQMPKFHKSFQTNKEFAQATKGELLEYKNIRDSSKVVELSSGVFVNNGSNQFTFKKFDNELQLAPINDILFDDYNLFLAYNTNSNHYQHGNDITNGLVQIVFEKESMKVNTIPIYRVVNSLTFYEDKVLLGINDDSLRLFSY